MDKVTDWADYLTKPTGFFCDKFRDVYASHPVLTKFGVIVAGTAMLLSHEEVRNLFGKAFNAVGLGDDEEDEAPAKRKRTSE